MVCRSHLAMEVDSALIVNTFLLTVKVLLDGVFHPYELKPGPLKQQQQQQRLLKADMNGAFDGDEGDRVSNIMCSPQTALLISC